MRWCAALLTYRLLLPVLFLAAVPGWWVKMLRRGGLGTRLSERAAVFREGVEFEPCGAVHIHAVSVGEVLLGLRLIRAWLGRRPGCRFVLATGTATGHAVATAAALPGLRVTYAPLDFPSMVRRYLARFEPSRIVLIEAEAWPHLLLACRKRAIPVSLVNARMSPRSARRFRRFAAWLRPWFGMLDAVAIQEEADAAIWRDLGVAPARIHLTGSLKFDPDGGGVPVRRPEFQQMLDAFGGNRPVILAASTHAGEDAWIASAIREAVPGALAVIAPRHAERRHEVESDLLRDGWKPVLRSCFREPPADGDGHPVLVIDTTGELRDWTAHADVVIIGKSFLSTGGQNPIEAVTAGKPVIFGPHMQNFEPLASSLVECHGAIRAGNRDELIRAIRTAQQPVDAAGLSREASRWIERHRGATGRILDVLGVPGPCLKSANAEFVISNPVL